MSAGASTSSSSGLTIKLKVPQTQKPEVCAECKTTLPEHQFIPIEATKTGYYLTRKCFPCRRLDTLGQYLKPRDGSKPNLSTKSQTEHLERHMAAVEKFEAILKEKGIRLDDDFADDVMDLIKTRLAAEVQARNKPTAPKPQPTTPHPHPTTPHRTGPPLGHFPPSRSSAQRQPLNASPPSHRDQSPPPSLPAPAPAAPLSADDIVAHLHNTAINYVTAGRILPDCSFQYMMEALVGVLDWDNFVLSLERISRLIAGMVRSEGGQLANAGAVPEVNFDAVEWGAAHALMEMRQAQGMIDVGDAAGGVAAGEDQAIEDAEEEL